MGWINNSHAVDQLSNKMVRVQLAKAEANMRLHVRYWMRIPLPLECQILMWTCKGTFVPGRTDPKGDQYNPPLVSLLSGNSKLHPLVCLLTGRSMRTDWHREGTSGTFRVTVRSTFLTILNDSELRQPVTPQEIESTNGWSIKKKLDEEAARLAPPPPRQNVMDEKMMEASDWGPWLMWVGWCVSYAENRGL